MTTAKATSADSSARSAAKKAPSLHAVEPVDSEHPVRDAKPVNVKSLPVRPGESPWTKAELNEVRKVLEEDIAATVAKAPGAIRPMSARPTSSATPRCRWPTMPVRCWTSPDWRCDISSWARTAVVTTAVNRSERAASRPSPVPPCASRASSARNGDSGSRHGGP
jgi:hypothetical protein